MVLGRSSYEIDVVYSNDVLSFKNQSGFTNSITSPDFETGLFKSFNQYNFTFDQSLKNGFPNGNSIAIPLLLAMGRDILTKMDSDGIIYTQNVYVNKGNGTVPGFEYKTDKYSYIIKRTREDNRGVKRITDYFYE